MIDFSAKLTDLEGHELPDDRQVNGAPVALTLGRVAANALLAMLPADQNMSGAEKADRYALAVKVVNAGEIKLPVEDVAKIKGAIDRMYGPLIVGQARTLLEG